MVKKSEAENIKVGFIMTDCLTVKSGFIIKLLFKLDVLCVIGDG